MFNNQSDKLCAGPASLTCTKMKNVTCVRCRHSFCVRDFLHIRGNQIPLLLSCGHAICESCARLHPTNPCNICENVPQEESDVKPVFPINVYVMGLLTVNQSRPTRIEEPKFNFQQPFAARLRQAKVQEQEPCSECGLRAESRCRQCDVLYCSTCFSKIHGRALQRHRKIMLVKAANESGVVSSNKCLIHPAEALEYYCKECELSACSHCMIRSHQGHCVLTQLEKNEELQADFVKAYEKVAETLQRVHQTQKKLKKALIIPKEAQNSETVEALIAQHFVQLHGVLQNVEKRLIDQLYEERSAVAKNLDTIKAQLREQEENLQSALLIGASARECFSQVNVQNIIEKLEEAVDVPCHLVQKPTSDGKIKIEIDKSIIEKIEDHCELEVPHISNFNLLKTENLPEDYSLEPINVEEFLKMSDLSTTLSRASSTHSITSCAPSIVERTEMSCLMQGSTEAVAVCYTKDPSCFYVHQLSRKRQFEELNKAIGKHLKTAAIPTELKQNQLYLVRNKKDNTWRRGRIKSIFRDSEGLEMCGVFHVDFGYTDLLVSVMDMRTISTQLSSVPPIALKCALHDIVPKDGLWNREATNAMLQMLNGLSHVTIHVLHVSGDTYYVDICKDPSRDGECPVSVRDALIFLEYGCFVNYHRLMRTNPLSLRRFYEQEIKMESLHDVEITHIESPHCLYARKIGENARHLDKLLNDMTMDYGKHQNSKGTIYNPDIGMPCAAPFDDKKWYRGRICGLPGERRVEVFYVDIGATRELQYDRIRRLHNKYMTITAQTLKMSLRDVTTLPENNGVWGASVNAFMRAQLCEKIIKMYVLDKNDDCLAVSLYIPGESRDVNFNALLVKEGYAQSVGPSTQHVYSLKAVSKKKSKKKTKKCAVIAKPKIVEHADLFKIPVKVLQVVSPDCIYVTDMDREDANAELMRDIQAFYNTHQSAEKEFWKKNSTCIAYSARDKLYFRAKIVEVKSRKEVIVFFLDTGITETVAMKDLQTVFPKFSLIPAFCFKVKLAGISPCGGSSAWPILSCQTLSDIIDENQNSMFFISKVGEKENDAISAELWVRQARTEGPLSPTIIEMNSVNRLLVDKGVALPVRGYKDKQDKVLAIELRQQLLENGERLTDSDVEWQIKEENSHSETATKGSGTSENITTESESESTNENDDDEDDDSPLPPNMAAWIPALPITERHFSALPTYVDHDCFVYLHSPKHNGKTLRFIDEALQEHYQNSKPKSHDMTWSKGDLCIAQFHADQKWYRAQVLEVLEDNMIKVVFVDYGNVDECKIDMLRKRVVMGHMPIQCTKCVVYGLNADTPDGKWGTKQLDMIHVLLVDKKCDVTILDRKPDHLVVSIMLREPAKMELITYITKELGLTVREEKTDSPINRSANTESDACTDSADAIVEGYMEGVAPQMATAGTFSQLCSGTQLVEFSENSIEKVIAGTTGFMGEINANDLNDSNEIVQSLDLQPDLTNMSWVDIITLDDPINASTPQNESEAESNEDVVDSAENTSYDVDPTVAKDKYRQLIIPSDMDTIMLKPVHLFSPTVFFAHLDESLYSEIEQFGRMELDLEEKASNQPKLGNIVLNSPCCVKYTRDGLWYRAMITRQESDSEVRVRYIDYGNEGVLPIEEIRTIRKEWLNVSARGVRCKLWRVETAPGVKISEIYPILEQLYFTDLLRAKIKVRDDKCYEVELYSDEECTKLLYAPLLEQGLFKMKESED